MVVSLWSESELLLVVIDDDDEIEDDVDVDEALEQVRKRGELAS